MPKPNWFSVRAVRASGDSSEEPSLSASEPEAGITALGAEVTIRGYIGEWGITDRDFIREVEDLGQVTAFSVLINSRGGDVDHALGIYDFLRNHPAKVTVRITGVAMSSASVIAMAGDSIEMPANTLMMIHNPWNMASGDDEDLQQAADQIKAWKQSLIETYKARTGKTEEEIRAMMKAETFMTAAEAVAMGFADVVLPIERPAVGSASAVAMAFASALGIPPEVAARIASAEAAAEEGAAAPAPEADPNAQLEGGDPSGSPAADADNSNPVAQAAGSVPAGSAPAPTFASQVSALAVAEGLGDHVSAWLLDADLKTIAQAHAAIAEAREVRDLCAFAGATDQAAHYIRSRKSLDAVRAELVNARAAAADKAHANGYSRTEGNAPANPSHVAAASGDVYARRLEIAQAAYPRFF